MNLVNRKASLLVVLMLVLALVVSACGSNNGKNATDTKDTPAAPAATTGDTKDAPAAPAAADLKPYKLTYVYEGPPQADEKLVEEALNKILTEKINATIDIAPIDWGAWDDKMNLMIASREPVDVLFTAQWNGHAKNVAKGAYLELGDLIQKFGQGILETQDPAFLEGAKINGKNYAVPTSKELAAAGGIVYRKDIADELGLDMASVKEPEDLGPIYAKVKEAYPDMAPLYTQDGVLFNAHYFAQYDALGDGTIPGVIMKTGTDTTVQLAQEMDLYKRYLKVARDFYTKGYINQDAATTQLAAADAFKAGVAFSSTESLKPGKAAEVANATNLQGKLDQIMFSERTVSTAEPAGSMLAISSTSADPERAMMFINLLHTDKEINNLVTFGIEGTHYTRNGDIISATDKTTNYAHGIAWQIGNQFLNYIWDTEDPNKWANFAEFNKGAIKSPALGFTFDPENVKTEVGAIANVIKQYEKAIQTGSVDPDKMLPEFVAALKAAGSDKVVAEKQKQLDAFIAAK
jgi:putative aldouronate transport system substrate-binding protein